jgi:serine/threonine protein kinase
VQNYYLRDKERLILEQGIFQERGIYDFTGDTTAMSEKQRSLLDSPGTFAAKFGWGPTNRKYEKSSHMPLQYVKSLGHGSLGVVDEVRIFDSNLPSFARKRVRIERWNAKRRLEILRLEVDSMRRLTHPHIVKILGTYEDDVEERIRFYSLLMSPVGDADLKTLLFRISDDWDMMRRMPDKERASKDTKNRARELQWLQTWFSCLSSALAYIHDQGVRHQDIKPSNIIHRGSIVYFADFSSSSHFDIGQTTSTDNPAATSMMYRAPEVANPVLHDQNGNHSIQRHGRGTDVFALGCVFMEMLVVMDGGSLSDFHDNCIGPYGYGRPLKPVNSWLHHNLSLINKRLYWAITPLLATDRGNRPLASDLSSMFNWLCPSVLGKCFCAEPFPPISQAMTVDVTPFMALAAPRG